MSRLVKTVVPLSATSKIRELVAPKKVSAKSSWTEQFHLVGQHPAGAAAGLEQAVDSHGAVGPGDKREIGGQHLAIDIAAGCSHGTLLTIKHAAIRVEGG